MRTPSLRYTCVVTQGGGEREGGRGGESFELTMKLTRAQGCQVFSTLE